MCTKGKDKKNVINDNINCISSGVESRKKYCTFFSSLSPQQVVTWQKRQVVITKIFEESAIPTKYSFLKPYKSNLKKQHNIRELIKITHKCCISIKSVGRSKSLISCLTKLIIEFKLHCISFL